MPRFFSQNIIEDKAIISGGDAVHISKSLRMKKGEEIIVCDTKGTDYVCELSEFGEDVISKIISSHKSETEPNVFVTLYQAMPKNDKLELIIQKCVELGVSKIVPVITKRCVSRPDEKSMEKKLLRYNKISLEAAKQSGRGIIPQICNMVSFKTAINQASQDDLSFICYEGGGKRFNEIDFKNKKSISIFIGGEGGFEEDEVQTATDSGIIRISLGSRILRCETAPIASVSIIMYLTNNMGNSYCIL